MQLKFCFILFAQHQYIFYQSPVSSSCVHKKYQLHFLKRKLPRPTKQVGHTQIQKISKLFVKNWKLYCRRYASGDNPIKDFHSVKKAKLVSNSKTLQCYNNLIKIEVYNGERAIKEFRNF